MNILESVYNLSHYSKLFNVSYKKNGNIYYK